VTARDVADKIAPLHRGLYRGDRDPVQLAEYLSSGRTDLHPFGPSGPVCFIEQGIYTALWDAPLSVMVEFDFVATDRHGETGAEMAVYWSDPADPLSMLRTRVNLVSLASRDRLAASLEKRTNGLQLDWRRMLDQAMRWTMEQYRIGEPGGLLRDAPDIEPGADLLTEPAILEADGGTILFGDGGSLKSWSGLALGASLQAGSSYMAGIDVLSARRVGFLDWEWSDRRHKRRLAQLTGPDMPDIAYIRCSRSIGEERDRLRRFARDHRLDYAIIDSVGLACGGEPESAEVASRFVNVANSLFPAWLGIAHVTKAAADRPPDKPFGSAYWHNSARRTWYARAAEQPGSSGALVGLYNKKSNDGPRSAPLALAFGWHDERVSIERTELRDVPELDAARSIPARMRDLLGRTGAMELHAIADELGEKVDSVKKAAQRGRREGSLVNFPGPDGVYRWALKQ
jgi:hypothetical protein